MTGRQGRAKTVRVTKSAPVYYFITWPIDVRVMPFQPGEAKNYGSIG